MDPRGIASELLLETLSDDAKCVLGGCFGMLGIPGRSTLTYQMGESRPTRRMQAALDELVEAGALNREIINDRGGATYTVQLNCSDFAKWMRRHGDAKCR